MYVRDKAGYATERGNFWRTNSQIIDDVPYARKPIKTNGDIIVCIIDCALGVRFESSTPLFKKNWPIIARSIELVSNRYLISLLYSKS